MSKHKPSLEEVVAQLVKARLALDRWSSGEGRTALDDATAAEFAAIILSFPAFLDDSVSTAVLGSLFDRTSDTALNRTLDGIREAFGATHSFASTTGTSAANAAAVMALCHPGETVIVDRGCHVSICAGLILADARPYWLVPDYVPQHDLILPPSPNQVRQALEACPEAAAIILTLPTYNGLGGEIAEIVRVCRRAETALMVDEAHGPHLRFLSGLGFPADAVSAGADIVTQSPHKVLPALNQASLVHVREDVLANRYARMQGLGFQSTSFSYPIVASLAYAVARQVNHGEADWRKAVAAADGLRRQVDAIRGLRVLRQADLPATHVTAIDPTRITVNVNQLGLTGWEVQDRLERLNVVPEMASFKTVLFLLGPSHGAAVDIIGNALRCVSDTAPHTPIAHVHAVLPAPVVAMSPREAFLATRMRRVPRRDAIGKIAAEQIGAYPPGRLAIGPGELVTHEVVEVLTELVARGGHLKRAQDDGFATIEILEE
jgi:arginine/lysine/ornithine decarboxylase